MHMNIAAAGHAKSKAVSLLCTAALALTLVPAAAFANTTGSTDIVIKAEDAQISVTAPTQIPLVIGPGGIFVTPDNVAFENNSAVPVYVKGFSFEGFNAVGTAAESITDFAESPDENVWYALAYPGEAEYSIALLTADSDDLDDNWVMGSFESDNPDLPLAVRGEMKNVTGDFSAGATAGKVTWTFGVTPNPAAE